MFEKKLLNLIDKAKKKRNDASSNGTSDFFSDSYPELTQFISTSLEPHLFRGRKIKIIANHFDEILPFITNTNISILFEKLLTDQSGFKAKFKAGLKKYPYKNNLDTLFEQLLCPLSSLNYDSFVDSEMLEIIAALDLNAYVIERILSILDDEKKQELLLLLAKYGCDIPYFSSGNNEESIRTVIANLQLFINNSRNLFLLKKFLSNNKEAANQVSNYIDNNQQRAMDSIFNEIESYEKISNPTIKEVVRLIILDVINNEKCKYSDIEFFSGGYSRVILVGNKVIKLGKRQTKRFPNNPYIVAPIIRRELEIDGRSLFVEVTERVGPAGYVSEEELYMLFKNLRDLGIVWTDIQVKNVGRLRKENIIHWQNKLEPSDETLNLDPRRGSTVLQAGELVLLDADFIYDENSPNIIVPPDSKAIYQRFVERYQTEKQEFINQGNSLNQMPRIDTNGLEQEAPPMRMDM